MGLETPGGGEAESDLIETGSTGGGGRVVWTVDWRSGSRRPAGRLWRSPQARGWCVWPGGLSGAGEKGWDPGWFLRGEMSDVLTNWRWVRRQRSQG